MLFQAGIVLVDLYQSAKLPLADLFASRDPKKSKALMGALDAINGGFGRESVRPGGLARRSGAWAMKRENLSPCYTTRLSDILRIKT